MSSHKKNKSVYADSKKRMIIATSIFCVLITILFGYTFSDWMHILTNKNNLADMKEEYGSLLEKEASLKSEVVKLQDPEYVARYAREKYYYSKEGELIIRLPED